MTMLSVRHLATKHKITFVTHCPWKILASTPPYHVHAAVLTHPLYLVSRALHLSLFIGKEPPHDSKSVLAYHALYTEVRHQFVSIVRTIVYGNSPSQRPVAIQNFDISQCIIERKKPRKSFTAGTSC